jgi:MFS family permease
MFLLLYARGLFGRELVPLVALWIVLHLSKMVFSIPGGMISDKIGGRPVIVAGWIMHALVYLGMALLNTQSPVSYFVALFVAYGFYVGMTEGAEKALVTDFIPSQFRGTAFGIYHGAVGLAALPASLLFGVFWTRIGPQVAFGVGPSLAGAAAISMTLLLSVKATQPAAD